jgi:hypothetical protein
LHQASAEEVVKKAHKDTKTMDFQKKKIIPKLQKSQLRFAPCYRNKNTHIIKEKIPTRPPTTFPEKIPKNETVVRKSDLNQASLFCVWHKVVEGVCNLDHWSSTSTTRRVNVLQ